MAATGLYINRQYVVDFETDLAYKIVDAWSRTMKRVWWPRIMLVEPPSASRTRILEWNQETARIHHLGPTGKDQVYDPLVTASHEIQYDHFGNGLKLDRSQISDDRIDRAANVRNRIRFVGADGQIVFRRDAILIGQVA